MRDGWRYEPATSGGWQCGTVRRAIAAGPAHSTVCHCRMCQRATGTALSEGMTTALHPQGTPATWASSDQVERGFCATCGTPLFSRGLRRDTTQGMTGTLTPGFACRPIANHGLESRQDRLATLPDLPDRITCGETITQRQTPEGP